MAGHLILKMRLNGAKILPNGGKMLRLGRYDCTTLSSTSYGIATTRSIFSAIRRIPIFGIEPFSRRASRCHFPAAVAPNGRNIRPHFPLNKRFLQTANNSNKSHNNPYKNIYHSCQDSCQISFHKNKFPR